MRSFRILFLLLAVFFTAVAVMRISIAEEPKTKTIRAVKIQSEEAPVIDGRLDDECWKKANNVPDFIQVDRRIANDGSMRGDGPFGDRSRAWDCSWEAKAAKTDKGWTAELVAMPVFCWASCRGYLD